MSEDKNEKNREAPNIGKIGTNQISNSHDLFFSGHDFNSGELATNPTPASPVSG